MPDFNNLIINKLDKVETDISQIKISVTENTHDLKHHIKRTDGLQEIVEDLNKLVQPMYESFISKKAIEKYKRQQKEDLVYKLKLPAYIVAAILAIGTIITFFVNI